MELLQYSKYIWLKFDKLPSGSNPLTYKDTDKDKDKEILFQVFKTHRKNM